jgi:hypothetical protein
VLAFWVTTRSRPRNSGEYKFIADERSVQWCSWLSMVPRWRPKRTPACRYCGFCAIRAEHAARYCRRGDRVIGRFFCCTAVEVGSWPDSGQPKCSLSDRYRVVSGPNSRMPHSLVSMVCASLGAHGSSAISTGKRSNVEPRTNNRIGSDNALLGRKFLLPINALPGSKNSCAGVVLLRQASRLAGSPSR